LIHHSLPPVKASSTPPLRTDAGGTQTPKL
jgi:hypothetical protein